MEFVAIALDFEAQTLHASDMILNKFSTLFVCFRPVFEETVVACWFRLRTCATTRRPKEELGYPKWNENLSKYARLESFGI